MSQAAYSAAPGIGFAGQIADSTSVREIITRANGEASAGMPFGVVVGFGSTDSKAILLADANTKIAGIVVRSHVYDPNFDLNSSRDPKPGAVLNIGRKGHFYVTVEEAVVPGDPVFVRHTANGGNTQKGAFRKSSDSSNAVAITGRYLSTAGAGEIALVSLNLE